MRIHALCIAKDEADVLLYALEKATSWADAIYFVDNGSSDGSWEAVNALAEREPKIIPLEQRNEPFREDMRRDIYMAARSNARPGDWWCRLDADEEYIDDPREIISRVPSKYDLVWAAYFNYFLTDDDVARFEKNPAAYEDSTPLHERCRHYINNWSEPRFLRHRPDLIWRKGHDWPSLVTHYPDARVRMRHYIQRSPQQIERRFRTRWHAVGAGGAFAHEILALPKDLVASTSAFSASPNEVLETARKQVVNATEMPEIDWRDRVVPAADLYRDEKGNGFVDREDLMPVIPRSGGAKIAARRILRKALTPIADYL